MIEDTESGFAENPSIVIVGIWNTGILTPQWYSVQFKDKIDNKNVRLELQFGANNMAFTIDDIKIVPEQGKLLFMSNKNDESTYEKLKYFAYETVSRLEYTPIQALGHNVAYHLEDDNVDIEQLSINNIFDGYIKLYNNKIKGAILLSQDITHTLIIGDCKLNLSYRITNNKKTIAFNYHYETNNIDETKKYINEFTKNIESSKELVTNLIRKDA
ncbi:MAG: hypothetical protein HQL03_00005 [Nitrospirae bacterium]|nr:hypothetical protein [Nitrospirota bacterium]